MTRNIIAAVMIAGCLSGCATTRFAPSTITGHDNPGTLREASAAITAYITAYSQDQRATARARQGFEVPALLSTIGSVTAVAFGAGTDIVIASGAVGALSQSGNTYYAPRAQSAMYRDATDALICLNAVANGGEPVEIRSLATDSRIAGFLAQSAADEEAELAALVMGGVRAIELVLTDRLSSAGDFAAASTIAAEYQSSVEEEIAAREAARQAAADSTDPNKRSFAALAQSNQRASLIRAMQANIQQCVLRAKG